MVVSAGFWLLVGSGFVGPWFLVVGPWFLVGRSGSLGMNTVSKNLVMVGSGFSGSWFFVLVSLSLVFHFSLVVLVVPLLLVLFVSGFWFLVHWLMVLYLVLSGTCLLLLWFGLFSC